MMKMKKDKPYDQTPSTESLKAEKKKRRSICLFLYRNFRKPSKSKVVYCTKLSIMMDGEGIIQYISFLQQFQMSLWNFNFCQNCISLFLLTKFFVMCEEKAVKNTAFE